MHKDNLLKSFEHLSPSDSQKEKMLSNILNYGMKKDVHKVSFDFKYAFTTAAVGLCAVAVAVTVGPWYNHHEVEQIPVNTPKPVVTYEDKTDDKADIAVSDNTVSDNTVSDNTVNESDSVAASDDVMPSTVTAETNETAPEINQEDPNVVDNYESTTDDNSSMMRKAPPDTDEGLGDEGSSMVSMTMALAQEMTIEEYYDYLGVNVEEKLVIPDTFTNETPHSSQIDLVSFDDWNFRYVSDTGYIMVNTTKNLESITNYINDDKFSKSNISGEDVIVIKNDDSYKAYMIHNEVGYTVDTLGVSQTELSSLLTSIVSD
ncbi:MAG: hypothetical protein PHE51_01675 [Eubacteriales bacterium]|nr:hypothetical protein [Eubacteriales bacterium]